MIIRARWIYSTSNRLLFTSLSNDYARPAAGILEASLTTLALYAKSRIRAVCRSSCEMVLANRCYSGGSTSCMHVLDGH